MGMRFPTQNGVAGNRADTAVRPYAKDLGSEQPSPVFRLHRRDDGATLYDERRRGSPISRSSANRSSLNGSALEW